MMNVMRLILHMNINTHLTMNNEDDIGTDKHVHNECVDRMWYLRPMAGRWNGTISAITWQPFVSQHWGELAWRCYMFKRLIAAVGIPALKKKVRPGHRRTLKCISPRSLQDLSTISAQILNTLSIHGLILNLFVQVLLNCNFRVPNKDDPLWR